MHACMISHIASSKKLAEIDFVVANITGDWSGTIITHNCGVMQADGSIIPLHDSIDECRLAVKKSVRIVMEWACRDGCSSPSLNRWLTVSFKCKRIGVGVMFHNILPRVLLAVVQDRAVAHGQAGIVGTLVV